MVIKSLVGVGFDEIANVFNEAFSDYYFPIRFTAEQFKEKFASENGVLEISVGVYDGEKLIGFIMHFFDEIEGKRVVYNGGTGVIPRYRGQGLTLRMYDYILPILKERQIHKLVHEVLSVNVPAIKVYEKVGFYQIRSLDCFKGSITIEKKNSPYQVKEIIDYDWDKFQSFWDYQPTWQNSKLALDYLSYKNQCFGVFSNEELLGYLIYNPQGNRINQLAVHKNHRKKGLATQLLHQVSQISNGKDIVTINIDSRLVKMRSLFEKYGMKRFIEQNDMEMSIDTIINPRDKK